MKDTMNPNNHFNQTIQNTRGGRLLDELSEKLQTIVAEAIKTGRKGTLQLKLTIRPESDADNLVVIEDEVKAVVPEMKRKPTFLYADEQGRLYRNDPRQTEMKFEAVSGDNQETEGQAHGN